MPIVPTGEFLDSFAEDGSYYLSLPFLWSVEFVNIENLNSSINNATAKLQSQKTWAASSSFSGLKIDKKNILAARQVTIPNEQSTFLEAGQNNRGGFLPGYGLQQRESFLTRSLAINFIETIDDIVHNLFTPWSIALSVDGLVNFGLRADIIVQQYDNQGNKRKGYKFIKAFPTNVEGFTVTQDPDAPFTEKTVTFSFKDYVPDEGYESSPGFAGSFGAFSGGGPAF